MTSFKPIFLIASERSGTNLVRRRFTECQDVYFGPAAAQFFKNLYFREPLYGSLESDSNFGNLVSDALDLCYVHFSPWNIRITVDEVVHAFGKERRNVVALSDHLMERYARSMGRERYFSKENFLYEFALDIAYSIPTALFVYLYRDPRDFVLSQMKRPGATRNVLDHARLWSYEQTKAMAVAKRLEAMGRCITLSYEDFIADESSHLARLCDFAGVRMHGGASPGRSADSIVEAVPEWSNLSKATIKDNAGKYLNELTGPQISRIEALCAPTMEHLGYRRISRRGRVGKVEAFVLSAWHSILTRARARFVKRPKSVRERQKLIARLHVNYRRP